MARRDNYYSYFESTGRIRTDEGLKTRSQKGQIGRSWWAARWIAALERLVDPGRLRRGRSYARSGQVLSVTERGGAISAKVQGSRPQPYNVTIRVKALSDAQWAAVVAQMAGRALFAAQLLAGEMPADIEEAFAAAGASLFPDKRGDLATGCSCPDDANPCKHIAATHYILGEQFDEDPFLLFRLRGRSQEQILDALRSQRAALAGIAEEGPEYETADEPEASGAPLEGHLDSFWQPAVPLETVVTSVKPPVVELPLLKRLGPPAFLPDQDLTAILGPAYTAMTRSALAMALGETETETTGEP